MKKEEIKADPIKERIVSFVNLIIDNSKIVWISFLSVVAIIIFSTYYSSTQKSIRLNENLELGILQNRSIHSSNQNDSLINEYENILLSYPKSESYNQAFIYMISHYINIDNKEKLEKLLFDNIFESDDDMQSSFVLKVEADFYNNNNQVDKAISNYKKAYNLVPSYELKIIYCTELINLYLSADKYDSASRELESLKNQLGDYEKLSFTSKNNFDYIESKLLHLVK